MLESLVLCGVALVCSLFFCSLSEKLSLVYAYAYTCTYTHTHVLYLLYIKLSARSDVERVGTRSDGRLCASIFVRRIIHDDMEGGRGGNR